MSWFFIAFIAPFLWSLVNVIDQFLVVKYGKRSSSVGALALFSSLIGIVISFFIFIFTPGVFNLPIKDILFLSLSGVLTIVWVLFYLFSLEEENASSVVPWFLSVPIFGYIFGFLFFGEVLTFNQQIGSLVILLGLSILSFDFSKKNKIRFKFKIAFYMFFACLFVSLVGVIFKYFSLVESFWLSSFWVYFGLGISGVIIYFFSKNYRSAFLNMIKMGGIKIVFLNILGETLSVVGNILTSYALLLAPIAMVFLVGSFQPAILLILSLILTKFFPEIIKENLSKRVLYPKIIAISIIVIGSIFLFV